MNLDITILKALKECGGEVSKNFIWRHLNNYSRGYLYERFYALKRSGWIIESKGRYILTVKRRKVKTE